MNDLAAIPIWQAPTGSIAGPELCLAVANAGGVGAMGLTWTDPAVARNNVRQVREATDQPFQANFVLHFEPKSLIPVLEEGCPLITFSWGMPDTYVALVRSFGAKLGVQVVNQEAAKRAIGLGADFLIAQGIEAGGHVQSSTPLLDLLPGIIEAAESITVVAAGGLADRADVERVLSLGVSGAMLGTRFVACQESRAHPLYKQALINSSDTALTLCFDGGWPFAQHRALKNKTFREWESSGSPPPGSRPGEGEALGDSNGARILRYDDMAPRTETTGRIDEMCLYAGTGCGKITDLPSAAELVARLAPVSKLIPKLPNSLPIWHPRGEGVSRTSARCVESKVTP